MTRAAWSFRLLIWILGVAGGAGLSPLQRSQGKSLRRKDSTADRAVPKAGSAQKTELGSRENSTTKAELKEHYAQFPLAFESNVGQTDTRVHYLARGGGYTVFLTSDEAVLRLSDPEPGGRSARAKSKHSSVSNVIAFRFEGGNVSPRISAQDELPGKSNYFLSKDAAAWRTNIPRYGKVTLGESYPGISLVYYGNGRQLEQDWVVSPGADPGRIAVHVQGAGRLSLDSRGDLRLALSDGELLWRKPVIYQRTGSHSEHVSVKGGFVLASRHRVRFQVGPYDHTKPLIIDPVLIYSSYLGGTSIDHANAIAIDSAGDAYIAGDTSSVDFPVTTGVLQSTCALDFFGICERSAFVSEINPSGTAELYSTYLGGGSDSQATPSSSQLALGIAVDSAGNAYVTGQTTSIQFPVQNAYQSACSLDANNVCFDAFVTVIGAGGTNLLYSSYLGGSGVDSGNAIAIDTSGDAYVAGQTASTDFPTTAGVIQTTCGTDGQCNSSSGNAQSDAFIAKINTQVSGASSLIYSTYLGGSGADYGTAIAIDSSLNAYVTGSSLSTDLPASKGAFQASCKLDSASVCEGEPYVAELNPTATSMVYLTYLGGSGGGGLDTAHGLALDSSNNAYVVGQTGSTDFPVTAGAFQTSCGTDGQCNPVDGVPTPHAFVSKLNSAGSALVYSTYLGGSGNDYASAVSVDTSNVPYVTGGTYSSDFPVTNATSTGGILAGGQDAFVTALNSQGTGLIMSTYLGGTGNDAGNGIARDANDNVFVVGSTASTDFPTLGPFQATNNGETDAFVTEIAAVTAPAVTLAPSTLTFASQSVSTPSAAQKLTLSNIGNASLTTTSIAASGDFAETNSCGASLAAAASCTIVTFTPTTTGARGGAITVTDNASTSPQSSTLTGTGIAPAVSFAPPSLSFASQIINTSSAAQTVTMTNVGSATLNITSVKPTGVYASDFSLTSACGTTLAVGKSCTMTVTFKPTVGGTLTTSISVTDNATGSPQTVPITGRGADFIISSWPTTGMGGNTVKAGKEAIYNIKIMPLGGYDQSVGVTCAGNPQNSTCVVSPGSATPTFGRVPVDVSLDVFTTAGSSIAPGPVSRRIPPLGPEGRRVLWLAAAGLGTLGLLLRRRRAMTVFALAMLSVMLWASCGSSNSTITTTPSTPGTAAGTYTLTVTGTSGSITHTTTTTLTVR